MRNRWNVELHINALAIDKFSVNFRSTAVVIRSLQWSCWFLCCVWLWAWTHRRWSKRNFRLSLSTVSVPMSHRISHSLSTSMHSYLDFLEAVLWSQTDIFWRQQRMFKGKYNEKLSSIAANNEQLPSSVSPPSRCAWDQPTEPQWAHIPWCPTQQSIPITLQLLVLTTLLSCDL